MLAAAAATTCDAFLDGRLILRQPARGHRAGTDAMLLAAAVPTNFCGCVDDVGAGVGAAGLALATLCPGARVRLVEKVPTTATLAAANIEANGLSARASVSAIDVLAQAERRRLVAEGRADLVVTNPPFYDSASFRASPDADRRAAHVLAEGGLAAWLSACLDLLGSKGSLVVIHLAGAVPTFCKALGTGYGMTILPVHPRAGSDASRILLRAIKGSRAPLRIAPALVLHEDDGHFTMEADCLHRGTATLRW